MVRLLLPLAICAQAAALSHAMSLRADVGVTPDRLPPVPPAAGSNAASQDQQSLGRFVPLPSATRGGKEDEVKGVQECTKEFDDKCGDQMEAVKDAVMGMNVPRLLRSAAGLVACVGENADDLWKHCRPGESKPVALPSPATWSARAAAVDSLLAPPAINTPPLEDHTKCHEEWRDECGKQADRLREAVQNADVAGIVMACAKVVECAHEHMDDLRKKCLPSHPLERGQVEAAKPVVTAVFVPPPPDAAEANYQNNAAVEVEEVFLNIPREGNTAQLLVDPPVKVEEQAVDLPLTGVRECTREFDDKCGKNLEQLKNAILSLDVLRLLHASLGLVACSAQNGQDIWEHCKPGKGQNSPSEAAVVVIPTLEEVDVQQRILARLLGPSSRPHTRSGPAGMMRRAYSKMSSFVNKHRPHGSHDEGAKEEEVELALAPQATMTLNMVHQPERTPREPEPETPMAAPMMPMPAVAPVQESKCKEEWDDDCGDKVETLKKRAEEGDVMGVLAGAVQVVQCAAEHIQELEEKCKPFASRHHHFHDHHAREPMTTHEAGWSNYAPPPSDFVALVQRQSGECYDVVLSVCGAQVSAIQTTNTVTAAHLDALENCLLESLPKIEALCAQRSAAGMPRHHHWGGAPGGGSGCLHRAMQKHGRLLHGIFATLFAIMGFVFLRRFVKRAYRCNHEECCNKSTSASSAKKTAAGGEASYVPLVEKGEVGPNAV